MADIIIKIFILSIVIGVPAITIAIIISLLTGTPEPIEY